MSSAFCGSVSVANGEDPTPPVELRYIDDHNLVLDNGIVQVSFTVPSGLITAVKFGGLDNLLGEHSGDWFVRGRSTDPDPYWFVGDIFTNITVDPDQVEISFVSRSFIQGGSSPFGLDVDRRYIMLRGSSGFYSYTLFQRSSEDIGQSLMLHRIGTVYKLRNDIFRYMAISDDLQRIMPTAQDIKNGISLPGEAVLLSSNTSSVAARGEVHDMYQYSLEPKNYSLHGWASFGPSIGFWLISVGTESHSGGPLKQELTCDITDIGPECYVMFYSDDYVGGRMFIEFDLDEQWQKVYGPYFVHLNTADDPPTTWEKAKSQLSEEVQKWPYAFDPKIIQAATVKGRLLIDDRYLSQTPFSASFAWVGLYKGSNGQWETEGKGYQFWTQTDQNGNFTIENVVAGEHYHLFVWIPGVVGGKDCLEDLHVFPGVAEIRLRDITFFPPRSGPTIWEIGIPDRSAAEFLVPDPDVNLTNRLFLNDTENKFRQYGLWDRYSELYPSRDLTYVVGVSDYHKDWFFTHSSRRLSNSTYVVSTWEIQFSLTEIHDGNYTFVLALASSSCSDLELRINDPDISHMPYFSTGMSWDDNAFLRVGIHGAYNLFIVPIISSRLTVGNNSFYLSLATTEHHLCGVMYDYLRLESPPPIS